MAKATKAKVVEDAPQESRADIRRRIDLIGSTCKNIWTTIRAIESEDPNGKFKEKILRDKLESYRKEAYQLRRKYRVL